VNQAPALLTSKTETTNPQIDIQFAIMAQTNNSSNTVLLEKKRSLTPYVTEEVRTVSISECEGVAQCLAEAFAVDEVSRYFVDTPDMANVTEAVKWKLHYNIMRYLTAAHCYKGIVTTVGEDYGAVALWYLFPLSHHF
jgi:Ser-tRNA(Ala) deacylase AlaX